MPLPLGGILGGAAALGKFVYGLHQNSLANGIHPDFQQYQVNPFAKQQLGLAQQLFNARMPGAASAERNIFQNQANTVSNLQRGATDSSQLLSLAGQAQGGTNQAINTLGLEEADNKQKMLGNLNAAYGQMINEGDKVYDSKFQKYQSDVDQKNALRNAGVNNIFGGVNDIGSLALMGGQLGWFGGGSKKTTLNGTEPSPSR